MTESHTIEDYWQEKGKAGFLVWRFRLSRDASQPQLATSAPPGVAPTGAQSPTRRASTIQRIVRNTTVTQYVKALHKHHCQLCGTQLQTPAGPYSEGAHIKSLGRPHHGPDAPENVLCVCPNCHVLFDAGVIAIADNLTLIGGVGRLRTVAAHKVGIAYIRYHRAHYGHGP